MNTPKLARILAVDDSPANIIAVRGMLGPDYEVSFATSGPQALGMLAQGYRPDLILLDVMMPQMDGFAVCAALKSDPSTQAIPVIFITARGDPQSETRALSAGGLDFIHKPLNAAVLSARVGLHLELRRQAQALGQANADLCRQAAALSTANAELSQHRDHLEDLVYARTQELAAALDAAQSADRAKSAFLLTVGHELRTPLSQIMGILPLVSKRLEDARLRDWLTKADAAARHLLRLIEDILHYVESESQDIAIACADFELAALLTAVERRIRPIAEAKGLELVVAVEPATAAWLKGDAVRLECVLWNLLDNAVKFSERGRITLTVRHSAAPGARCELRFDVTDQGIGMTPEVQETLFALFQQGDSGLTRRYGGTGLGLALCKRLVARMAGEVGFGSTPGEGSRFWFSLRLPVGAAPTAPAGGARAPDRGQVNTIIAALEHLLGTGDFAVLPLWAESYPSLEPILGERLAAIEEAITGFEFDTALRRLREAQAACPPGSAGP
ncbi:ATP-binding protein [uncultured Thiodictyon sp.]|uniref:hybrid sensor histidine kinase/response regulator n=1 Tax=uncultured Thiodictyon sp. TaxID=1846217 RepID=UPI0025E9FD9A|nr:ATP-binding protein [uncultured Thiodictyon sp.]